MATVTASLQEQRTRRPALMEMAGAFGDIGVLFPIAIALITLNRLNPTAVFLAAGLTYILAGMYFRIPIAVQPLKAVAAIALATGLPSSAIASAGILMGVALALIAVTGTAKWLARLFTLPIVRGIQLGLGLMLIREGVRLIAGKQAILAFPNGAAATGWMLALGAAIVLVLLRGSQRFPAALVLLGAGIALGILVQWGHLEPFVWRPVPIVFLHPSAGELRRVFTLLVIPQFALTFGNSIVATENTAQILYGDQAKRVTVRGLCVSLAIVNLASGMIQAAPMCHGSGGITAHYRFGARTAKASYIIGVLCLLLALLGGAALAFLHLIPIAILGVFLAYVGLQHTLYVRDIAKRLPLLFIVVCIGIIAFITSNLMWGFLVGFVLQAALTLYEKSRRLQAA